MGKRVKGMTLRAKIAKLWSATEFESPELSRYADGFMLIETRRGLMAMALLSLVMHISLLVAHGWVDMGSQYARTSGLLAALSLHVLISAYFTKEIRVLHMLGTALLVISAAALMLLAHSTGSLSPILMAGLVMVLMAIPLVPWGLRESVMIVGLTYLMLTGSSISVPGRFDPVSLWSLQYLILAAAVIATILVARTVGIRKVDLGRRFDLEMAHDELQLLSNRDPLTGAWNRRFLEQKFDEVVEKAHQSNKPVQFALMDVNGFKQINDNLGHEYGDTILRHLADVFSDNLPGTGYLIRLGGDEFAVLLFGENCREVVSRCLKHLATDPKLLAPTGSQPVQVSVGFADLHPGDEIDLTTLYRRADAEMYSAKRKVRRENSDTTLRAAESPA